MTVYVFVGPSLSRQEVLAELDARVLPPVSQGDLFRVAREAPFAIGVIDGTFERTPAVHHKEILWALSKGIHVFGGASMGALRAAEMSPFGMRGVGKIYEAYQAGVLQDDDEVAVAHGDESTGYRATSEAMVNIRATLRAAERAGAVGAEWRGLLEDVGKALFYPDRTYPALLAAARDQGVPDPVLNELRSFVQRSKIDAKRADALAVLRAIRASVEAGEKAPVGSVSFVHTDSWEKLVRDTTPTPVGAPSPATFETLSAEIRLLGDKGEAILTGALTRSQEKARLLGQHGHTSPRCADAGLERERLFSWYFVELLGRPVPRDMAAALARMGLPDVTALDVEAAREFLFRRLSGN